MAKVNVNAITRLQLYLAAIAGDATAPTPITDFEKLLYNIAEAVGAAGESELPSVSGSDNGMLLGVSSGKWAKVAAPTELPAYSATQNGMVLGVVDGTLTWVNLPSNNAQG